MCCAFPRLQDPVGAFLTLSRLLIWWGWKSWVPVPWSYCRQLEICERHHTMWKEELERTTAVKGQCNLKRSGNIIGCIVLSDDTITQFCNVGNNRVLFPVKGLVPVKDHGTQAAVSLLAYNGCLSVRCCNLVVGTVTTELKNNSCILKCCFHGLVCFWLWL